MKLDDLQLTPSDIARFWTKVDRTPGHGPKGECWLYTGAVNKTKHGYGVFTTCHDGTKTRHYAHRLGFLIEGGEIEPRQVVMHTCDTPRCVRPQHLTAGQPFENLHDKWAKGRSGFGARFPVTCEFALAKVAHARGFTQESLATAADLPPYVVRFMWQNKVSYINIGILSRLSEVLECEPGDFFKKAA
jgi:DNA-binding Xre family transcriptional regulator